MEAAPPSDAKPRAFGSAASALALLAGCFLATPIADAVSPNRLVLGPVSFLLLLAGSLALVGYAAQFRPLAWAGAGVAMVLYAFARLAWPYLPFAMLLLAAAAWWQARRPSAPYGPAPLPPFPPAWQPAAPPAPLPPAPRRR